jgi:tetratricopeptide (TPR) repeat protein
MTEAERQLDSANPEEGDVPARSAQDILASLPSTKDAQLAESLNRVAQYWERRSDWAESARIYQRAVKAYEKTPAENANPQLKVVSRWAAVLRRSGRNTEAERLYRMLIQAYEGLGPDLHPEMAAAAHNLAEILATTNRLRDAREYYARAVAIMAERPSDPRLDHFKDGFSECLRKLGVSEAQIEADTRQILESKSVPNPPSGS